MLFLPPEGRNLTVQHLDRPPLGHNRDGTSAPANRNTRRPGPSRHPPRSQPGLPVGTDTITIVAVNPDGLVSAPSNSFTGLFTVPPKASMILDDHVSVKDH